MRCDMNFGVRRIGIALTKAERARRMITFANIAE